MVWFIKSTQYFPKAVMEPYAGQPPSRRIYLLLDYTKYLKTTRKYLCELFPYSFWENFHSTFIRFLYPSSQQYLNARLIDMAEEITFTALKHISAFFRWVETYWTRIKHFPYVGHQVLAESPRQEYYFFLLSSWILSMMPVLSMYGLRNLSDEHAIVQQKIFQRAVQLKRKYWSLLILS